MKTLFVGLAILILSASGCIMASDSSAPGGVTCHNVTWAVPFYGHSDVACHDANGKPVGEYKAAAY